jgi:hypothetical protein
MSASLSIIIPCCDDFENFKYTLSSLKNELLLEDEIIIIDSSDNTDEISSILNTMVYKCPVKYFWTPKSGVYDAQNRGIDESGKKWIQIINSGDSLCAGGRQVIMDNIIKYPDIEMHVYGGISRIVNELDHFFSPTSRSLWPHQSIIVAKHVYDELGHYQLKYRYIADQIFFAKARYRFTYQIYSINLTEYLLGGMSSSVKMENLQEIYILHRAMKRNILFSYCRAYILPLTRKIMESILGVKVTSYIKSIIFPHYKRLTK